VYLEGSPLLLSEVNWAWLKNTAGLFVRSQFGGGRFRSAFCRRKDTPLLVKQNYITSLLMDPSGAFSALVLALYLIGYNTISIATCVLYDRKNFIPRRSQALAKIGPTCYDPTQVQAGEYQ